MRSVWRIAAALAAALGLAPEAFAGAVNIPCGRPFVFRDAAVNVVLLPYAYAGDSPRIDATSQQLSRLAQLDSLFSILKYDSVGAVQHAAAAPSLLHECDTDLVINKLLGRVNGAQAQVRPGHGLVVLWGRFYESRGDIFVQSYVRFLRRGVPEEGFTLTIDSQPLSARTSATGFAFAPRLVTRKDLELIQQRFSDILKVHSEPRVGSFAVDAVRQDPNHPFSYTVAEVRGNWMRLNANGTGPDGWVQADVRIDDWSLRRKLPELVFVEAVVGYLWARIEKEGMPPLAARRDRATAALRRALPEFSDARVAAQSQTPLAEAVGRQLVGMLRVALPEPSAVDLDAAVAAFEDALSHVPADAAARNLAVTARLYRAMSAGEPVAAPRTYVDAYLAITAMEPRNRDVLQNLESLLELMSREGDTRKRFAAIDLPRDDILKRLATVRAVRKALAPPGAGY